MNHMSQLGDTKGDGIPPAPHGTAFSTPHPRSQHDVVGLRLQNGVPELPKSPREVAELGTWMHAGTRAAPSAMGQPKATTHAVAGCTSAQSHTAPPALELPPCSRQGHITVPTCPNQSMPTPPALTNRAVRFHRGGRL